MTDELNQVLRARRGKLETLREKGVEPFAYGYDVTASCADTDRVYREMEESGSLDSDGYGEVVRIAIPLIEVPEKVERFAASLFGNTTVSGVIVDKEGKPLEGLRALLYKDEMMLNRPEFVSQPTGSDGQFVVSFPQGGTYYLAARNVLGGTPAPGDNH